MRRQAARAVAGDACQQFTGDGSLFLGWRLRMRALPSPRRRFTRFWVVVEGAAYACPLATLHPCPRPEQPPHIFRIHTNTARRTSGRGMGMIHGRRRWPSGTLAPMRRAVLHSMRRCLPPCETSSAAAVEQRSVRRARGSAPQ